MNIVHKGFVKTPLAQRKHTQQQQQQQNRWYREARESRQQSLGSSPILQINHLKEKAVLLKKTSR